MAIDLLKDRGTPLEQQRFTWKELVQPTYSKLDDDAFTRVRVILMNGIETEAMRFGHSCARMNGDLQLALAEVRRIAKPPSATNRSRSKSPRPSRSRSLIRISPSAIASVCSRISIICTATRR